MYSVDVSLERVVDGGSNAKLLCCAASAWKEGPKSAKMSKNVWKSQAHTWMTANNVVSVLRSISSSSAFYLAIPDRILSTSKSVLFLRGRFLAAAFRKALTLLHLLLSLPKRFFILRHKYHTVSESEWESATLAAVLYYWRSFRHSKSSNILKYLALNHSVALKERKHNRNWREHGSNRWYTLTYPS